MTTSDTHEAAAVGTAEAQPSRASAIGSASGLITRLAAKLEAIGRAQKAIPGEPCAGTLMHCKNPRHSEYFYLTVERERLRGLMARAKRLPKWLKTNGEFTAMSRLVVDNRPWKNNERY